MHYHYAFNYYLFQVVFYFENVVKLPHLSSFPFQFIIVMYFFFF